MLGEYVFLRMNVEKWPSDSYFKLSDSPTHRLLAMLWNLKAATAQGP